jgi:hypothetical protein
MSVEIAMGRCYQLISFKNDCLNNLTQDQVFNEYQKRDASCQSNYSIALSTTIVIWKPNITV